MAKKWDDSARKYMTDSVKDVRSITFWESVKKSFRFCVEPKRFLPFLVLDLAAVTAVLLFVLNVDLTSSIVAGSAWTAQDFLLLGEIGTVMILWIFASIFVAGALIHQSWKPKEFRQSWSASLKRYPSMLLVAFLAGLIAFLASFVPVIGSVLSFVFSIAFLFIYQFVMVGGKGFYGALEGSAKTFRNKSMSVFVTWLLSGIFTMIIILVFALPAIALFAYSIAQYGAEMALVYMMVYNDRILIYLLGGILLLGLALSKTFGIKFLTEIYLQMNKKKFFVF